MKRRMWTQAEQDVIRDRYPSESTRAIAADLGRSKKAVGLKARKMGIRKLPEAKSAGQFHKGMTPWNAGKKGWQAGGRSNQTQFRAGHKPHTWRPIGSERIDKDGHLVRKVTDSGDKSADWRKVHHLIWEAHNGSIPDDMVLAFRDGNPENLCLDNLELLTRSQVMRRNSYLNLPKPLADVIRLRGAVNRQINKRARG